MSDLVLIAIIGAVPPTVTAFVWGWVNHKKIAVVEVNTNDKLTRLLSERDAATTRADHAEGKEQERTEQRGRDDAKG